jgi:IS5 family transposase
LAAEIDRVVPRPSKLKGGRPPFPTELMVRVLLVQQMFNLSDEQMEYQLLDRLSFQRFVGLRDSSQIPDRTTIWTFKERLIAAKASDRIFEAANAQLSRHGYVARGGQMIDASLVPVPTQHIGRADKAIVEQGATPLDWSPAQRRQKDTEAAWVKKHGKSHFGFKLTTSTDVRYKLIRKIAVSTASAHDTLHLEAVLDEGNTRRDLYADKGYTDKEREARLKQQGWRPHIQRKAKQGKPLSACQERRNNRISKTRVRVEHPYAALEQMGGKLLRSIGLARAELHLSCKVATYNLRRLCYLIEAGISPLRSRVAS